MATIQESKIEEEDSDSGKGTSSPCGSGHEGTSGSSTSGQETSRTGDVVITESEAPNPPRPLLLVGPVVGHVTSTTANVLLEIDTDVNKFEVILRFRNQNPRTQEHKQVKDIKARRPTVFHFKDLPPSSAFNIIAPAISPKNIGMIRTFPATIEHINIAFLSCDRVMEENGHDQWEVLWRRVNEDQLQVVLHLGDNVYLDEGASYGVNNEELVTSGWQDPDKQHVPYVRARNLLETVPHSLWHTKTEEIREIYRDVYRKVSARIHHTHAHTGHTHTCTDICPKQYLGSCTHTPLSHTHTMFTHIQTQRKQNH